MRFKNREEAAQRLAERLSAYRGQNPLVLGVPRGAVPMARTIADALNGELDVVLVRKLRAPGQPELAIGAVDEAGTVLKGAYFDIAAEPYLREEIRTQRDILRARRESYTRAQATIDAAGRVVIIVDDGVATGSSMLAAIRAVRARKPQKIVAAIGVAPAGSGSHPEHFLSIFASFGGRNEGRACTI
jgi:putative phosphoribosyl transferase